MVSLQADRLPAEIHTTDRALVWKRERRDGKETKVPYRPGRPAEHAAVNDPATWGDFGTALANVHDGKADGVGLVLGNGIVGVDLDDCRDPETGELEDWARRVVDHLDSYTEVSPSGTGLHVLARGSLPDGRRRKGNLEMYSDGRYFTLTGHHLDDTPAEIRQRSAELAALHARVFEDNGRRERSPRRPSSPLGISDRELIERAQDAENGAKFRALWSGDTSGYDSHSEADLALVNLLAFWTRGEVERIDRLFRRSGLMREKWEREDYRERTISAALEGRTDYWEPSTEVNRTDGGQPSEADAAARSERELTLTDTGNSERLVQLHGNRLHFLPEWDKWLTERDGFWSLDHEDVRVRELAKDVGRWLKQQAADEPDNDQAKKLFSWGIRSLSSGRISAMVNLARGIGEIPLDYTELDADGWLLGVDNGVIELETGRLREADPSDLITLRCPVAWDEDADAPRWEQAIREWFPDEELRSYVQRVAGAALVGGQRDHRFIIHFGGGSNGKGTFTRALQNVLGPYVIEAHLSLLVDTKFKEHDTVRADLFRKRLAVAAETERRIELAESSVKNLTGGDRIRARRMREDPWSFDPTHSLWLQTNHLPEINGQDEGIWRRIRVVKWESTFRGDEVEKDLDEKLADEAEGILRWLVAGCLEWQSKGLSEPEKVIRDTLAYREKEDVFARFKHDVDLTFSPELEIQAGELKDLITEWANAEGIGRPQGYGGWLKENGASRKQRRVEIDGEKRRRWFWVGVGIDDDEHRSEQTEALP